MSEKMIRKYGIDCFFNSGEEVFYNEDIKICEKCGGTNLIEMVKVRKDL